MAIDRLLRLREKHQHARTFVRHELKAFLVESVRYRQAVARLVVGRLPIDQEHVMVRLVARDVMDRGVPRIQHAVPMEGNALPA